jgi:hypothetical protein
MEEHEAILAEDNPAKAPDKAPKRLYALMYSYIGTEFNGSQK